jgi:tetratricopeptide (TPR) repeat protein
MKALRITLSGLLMVAAILVAPGPVTAQQYKEDFNAAREAAQNPATLADARSLFASAATGADEASDTEVAQRARQIAAHIDYKLGTEAFKAEDYPAALEHYLNGENIFPAFIKNLYGKGLALKNLDRIDEALDAFKTVAGAQGDRRTSLAAEKAIRDHFMSQASTLLAKRNATRADADAALAALASLSEFMEADADVHYYTALAHYTKGEGEEAITVAQQALNIHSGSRSDKAKIYYVLGEAYVSVGNRDAARDAFSNAVYGTWKQSAEHYLETL